MKRNVLIRIIFIIICVILFINNCVCAAVVDRNISINNSGAGQFDIFGSQIISTIRVIGMIISVVALMIIGIRYMISSVEEKAEQKQAMIYYCIGAILVFAIVNIVSAVYEWTSNL